GDRLNRRLATFGAIGRGPEGSMRVAFSDADREARAYVRQLMGTAGLDVRTDAAGNLLGRRPGVDGTRPPLWMGSHVDSVPQGGDYDGPLGVLAAIEAVQTLADR
ncbi:MAG: Zn-dependent hydrolase, partial [Gemmatimonadetes bacterium]|nr:Zn-dependent hydrolase [Gemmatimonadota bacterium]NIQ55424.1 Zn-dependent hydrolase [Gemmatimonadota bacterium]NIU75634.1 Zn-dependent hydrolase [Gammaproteobacteria bacterium]NIX21622.1 Zn-dependent hydrolase [Actinomycetota bacterium]NIX45315.1 Zn-dependent hydrolase [Gemmatimonadota bacterium]